MRFICVQSSFCVILPLLDCKLIALLGSPQPRDTFTRGAPKGLVAFALLPGISWLQMNGGEQKGCREENSQFEGTK